MIPQPHIENINGVEVKSNIPYEQKELMAAQLAAYTTTMDNEHELIYKSFKYQLIRFILVAKYYTNIDLTDAKTQEDWRVVFDWAVATECYTSILDYVGPDLSIVSMLYTDMQDASFRIYNKSNDVVFLLKKMFGSLITDENFAENIAKSQVVNRQMIDLIGAYMKQREQQPTAGKIKTTGGAVINFAKKK